MLLTLSIFCYAQESMIADITESVETEFGTYIPYLVEIEPDVAQYEIESDFSNVVNFTDFNFTEVQKEKLLQNHFVVIPGRDSGPTGYKEIYDIYNEARENDIPQFITTDAVLHTYHKLYDKILMTVEEDFFIQFLIHMDSLLLEESLNYFNNSSEDFAKECFKKVVAYFSVPMKILDKYFVIPDSVTDIVNQELSLIDAHEGYVSSPLFNAYDEDYSQYKPRGHYTKTDSLEKYFKAMMWHGRQTYVLFNSDLVPNPCAPRPDLTGSALALIYFMENIQPEGMVWTYWNNIYIPTVFFVGKADDLLPQDYLTFAKQYFGVDFSEQSIDNILVETTILDFITQADEYFPEPLITTNTPKGMRFMGQRFIPDSYMLDQLVFPFVPDRLMPKSLDVLAVINSDEAYNLLDEMGETNYVGYIQQLAYLKDLYENYPDEQWAENLYWNWLYCLMPLLFEKDEGFPPFMQNLAWLRKDINTALGSWTELRHDTILYAKQSCTEYTGLPTFNNIIQGYVESNPYLFARLASLSKLMREGLLGLSILNEKMEGKLAKLEELLLTLKSISEKELTGGNITMDEYSVICNFGQSIEDLVSFGEEYESGNGPNPWSEDEMPVIADVHTDSNTGTCLEEGVGYPFRIFVICKVEDELKVTVGGIFSYYEFIQPLSNRLTDEEWAEMLASETTPNLPYWTGEFIDTTNFTINSDPDYYYLSKEGVFNFNISFSDTNPQIEENVLLNLTFLYYDLIPDSSITVIVENEGIEPFELEITSIGDNQYESTFSTTGMTEGKIYITINSPFCTNYRESIVLGSSRVKNNENILPSKFALHQNYPNPFNSSTQIQYDLPISGFVKLNIYNILGGEVLQIKNEYEDAGYKTITWNGVNKYGEEVPTGVYLYRVDFGEYNVTKKMLLIK